MTQSEFSIAYDVVIPRAKPLSYARFWGLCNNFLSRLCGLEAISGIGRIKPGSLEGQMLSELDSGPARAGAGREMRGDRDGCLDIGLKKHLHGRSHQLSQ